VFLTPLKIDCVPLWHHPKLVNQPSSQNPNTCTLIIYTYHTPPELLKMKLYTYNKWIEYRLAWNPISPRSCLRNSLFLPPTKQGQARSSSTNSAHAMSRKNSRWFPCLGRCYVSANTAEDGKKFDYTLSRKSFHPIYPIEITCPARIIVA